MKTAMKKLLSFVLVAMLLVSAIPFQASAATDTTIDVALKIDDDVVETQVCTPNNSESAVVSNLLKHYVDSSKIPADYELVKIYSSKQKTEVASDATIKVGDTVTFRYEKKAEEIEAPEVEPIKIVVKVDSSDNVVWTGEKVPANGVSAIVKNLLNYCWNSSWDDVYEFDHAWSHAQQKNVALDGSIAAGDTVYIMVNKISSSSSSDSSNSDTITNKFPYKVYLHIYLNNKVDEPDRTVNITSGIALDGVVTLNEAKTVVKSYYTAKNSDGIGYDGLYLAEGNWVGDFVNDTHKYDTDDNCISNTNEMRKEREVHINVMITNATAKTTTTSAADTSNPKTGDSIYMVMSVMGLSAAALVVLYYVSKKRAF